MLLGVVSSGTIFWMVVISKWCGKRNFLLKFSVWQSTDTLFQHIDNTGNRCNCQFAYSEEKERKEPGQRNNMSYDMIQGAFFLKKTNFLFIPTHHHHIFSHFSLGNCPLSLLLQCFCVVLAPGTMLQCGKGLPLAVADLPEVLHSSMPKLGEVWDCKALSSSNHSY